MKKVLLFICLLTSLLTQAQVAQFDVNGDNKANVTDLVLIIDSLNKTDDPQYSIINQYCTYLLNNTDGQMYVDLGLPSHTLWATCNIGANTPEQYGKYFAWGETQDKERYDWASYRLCNGSYTEFNKYNNDVTNGEVDNLTILSEQDDAAHALTGPSWSIPTYEDIMELRDARYCTWTATTLNGISGYLVTSNTNGQSIFLPMAGRMRSDRLSLNGMSGYYWSTRLGNHSSTTACCMVIDSSNFMHCTLRSTGCSIRPVQHTR